MKSRILFAAGCLAFASYLPAFAQQTQQAADKAAPPKLEKLEEGEAPAVTIRGSEGKQKMTEKRQQGKVTEVKVQTGSSTYYLRPNTPAGTAQPGDAQSDTTRPAEWHVLEFNSKREKDKKAAAEEAAVPAPPEPPAKK